MESAMPAGKGTRRATVLVGIALVLSLLLFLVLVSTRERNDPGALARDMAAEAQMNTIQTALLAYKSHNSRVASTDEGLRALVNPKDGGNKIADQSMMIDPLGHAFQYRSTALTSAPPFELWSMGADGIDGTSDDVRSSILAGFKSQ